MKKYLYLFVVVVLGLALLASCSSDSSSTSGPDLEEFEGLDNPAKYDFHLVAYENLIFVEPVEDDSKDPDLFFNLEINGEVIEPYMGMAGFYEYPFVPGNEYDISFTYLTANYQSKLTMPYEVIGEVSPDFDPTQDFNLSWQVEQDNPLQFVLVEAYDWEAEEEDYEMYFKLSPSAREYTIKANSVEVDLQEYSVSLYNVNYKISGRAVFMGISFIENEDYDWCLKTSNEFKHKFIDSIINAIK